MLLSMLQLLVRRYVLRVFGHLPPDLNTLRTSTRPLEGGGVVRGR